MADDVAHHAELVQELVNDHRQLLEAYHGLKRSADDGDITAFRAALARFKSLLVPHVVKEAYKVYTYLRQTLKARGDMDAYQRVNGYKAEMGHIGEAAIQFIDTYTQAQDDDIDFEQVRSALREIGVLLGDQIRREEADLYPLYRTLN